MNIFRKVLRITIFCALNIFLLHAQPTISLKDTLPFDKNITVGKLSNGLTYYIRANAKPEKRAELHLIVKTGSVLEDADQQGLAHFVEHMAFNGTKNFPKMDLVNFLERTGVRFGPHLNAYTSFDETVYMLQIPTDSQHVIEKAFQILEDWSHNISFDSVEIDKERGVVGEEWRLGKGAMERIQNKHNPIVFYNSQYAQRLPIGKKEVIDTAKYETLRRFYADWYRPELMSVVAVGDFDKAAIEKLIQSHFEKLTHAPQPRLRTEFTLPKHKQTLVSIASDAELPYTFAVVLFKRPECEEKTVADYRQQIIGQLYDGILNARLGEIVQKPNPPFIFASAGSNKFVGATEAYELFAGVKETAIMQGIAALLQEAFRVQQHGFTQTELDRQKKEMLRGMEKAFAERKKSESEKYMQEYTRHVLYGEPVPGIEYENELYNTFIPGITLAEVNALSQERITPENRVVTVSAPKKDGVVLPSEKEIIALIDSLEKKQSAAYVDSTGNTPLLAKLPRAGKILSEKKLSDVGVTEWSLSNGARVVLKPTDFKDDEVLMQASSPGGTSTAKDKEFLSANFATTLVRAGGIGEIDAIALQKMLSGKIAGCSPFISDLQEGFSGSASPKDLETMFQLLYLEFTAPRKDTNASGAYISRIKSFLKSRNAYPETAFQDTVHNILSSYHYRALPMTEDRIDSVRLDVSYNFYKNRFADAGDFTFFFVGNFTLPSIKPFVEKYIASLPALRRKESWKDNGIRWPSGVFTKEVVRGVEPKSSVQLFFSDTFEWSQQHRFDFNAMLEVLRIKLREQLREEKGGVYGVSVNGSTEKYPRQEYAITISFGCNPSRVQELITTALLQIDSLKLQPPAHEYITKVQEMQLREYEVNLKENNYWLSSLSGFYFYNEDPSRILQRKKMIDGLTATTIQTAAQRYFAKKNFGTFILNPEKK